MTQSIESTNKRSVNARCLVSQENERYVRSVHAEDEEKRIKEMLS